MHRERPSRAAGQNGGREVEVGQLEVDLGLAGHVLAAVVVRRLAAYGAPPTPFVATTCRSDEHQGDQDRETRGRTDLETGHGHHLPPAEVPSRLRSKLRSPQGRGSPAR